MQLLAFLQAHNIKEFDDVAKVLRQPPYCINVKERGKLYSLTYDMINSDMSIPLVQECRGLFLRKGTNKIVAKGFTKFFNAKEGKSCVNQLDRASVRYIEKLDGSLIKLYWDDEQNKWVFGTNNVPEAKDARLPVVRGQCGSSFDDLIRDARGYDIKTESLLKHLTYCFELIHPRLRIVVDYHGSKRMVFLGAVNIDTMQEHDERSRLAVGLDDWVEIPREFSFDSIEKAMEAAHQLGSDQEGWIAVDKNFNRVKIKGDVYVMMHHACSKQTLTDAEALKIVCSGEMDEICAYTPKFKPLLSLWAKAVDNLVQELYASWQLVATVSKECVVAGGNRKVVAMFCRSHCQASHMSLLMTFHDYVRKQPLDSEFTTVEIKTLITQSNAKSLLQLLIPILNGLDKSQ
jgi:hypothetical protein